MRLMINCDFYKRITILLITCAKEALCKSIKRLMKFKILLTLLRALI